MTPKPHIVQAADAVAYLPLYDAEVSGLRLQIPGGEPLGWKDLFGEPYRHPPSRFLESFGTDTETSGDRGCLNAIKQAWCEGIPLIGICDPCLVAKPDFHDLVIVGGLISRACFWCLADRDLEGHSPEELKPTKLFIHEPSFVTGNKIGEKIREMLARHERGAADPIYGSFELLIDGAVWQKADQTSSSVAAISASILSCVLAEERGFHIAFAVNGLSDFDPLLSTAIVVHRQALLGQHVRDALKLLILALRRSQIDVLLSDNSVKLITELSKQGRFAEERRIDSAFVEGRHVRPLSNPQDIRAKVTPAIAERVWQALAQNSIYSDGCEITEEEWENAWRVRDEQAPPLSDHFTPEILSEASSGLLAGQPKAPLLRLDSVSVGYGDSSHVLQDVKLTLQEGEIVGLAGPNGAGKSTLLRAVAGVADIRDGKIIRRNGKLRIAYSPQEDVLLDYRTAWQNVALLLERAPSVRHNGVAEKVRIALERVGLAERGGALPGALSGGMRQRVQIAQALVPDCDIILLDEPFAQQDRDNQRALENLIHAISRRHRRAVLLVSHDLESLGAICDRVLFLGSASKKIVDTVSAPSSLRTLPEERREHPEFENFSAGLWRARSKAARK